MYIFEGKHYQSASDALQNYIIQWEQENGPIKTPNFTVQNNRDIKKAVHTIWNSLGVQECHTDSSGFFKKTHSTERVLSSFHNLQHHQSPIITKGSDFGI
jgi:hypothetical protein